MEQPNEPGNEVIDPVDAEDNDDEDSPNDDDTDSSSSSLGSSSSDGNSSDESSELDVSQTLDLLANNDPDLTSLCMSSIASFDNVTDWRRIGLDIGRNTNLELLTFHHVHDTNVTQEHYEALFEGLVQNKSIRDIDFLQSNIFRGRVFPPLTPILERCLQFTIEDCDLGPEGSLLLSNALSTCSTSSLEEINFDQIDFGDEVMHVIKALKVHTKLEKISLRGNNIGTSGCLELLHLFPNRNNNSRLIALDLGENDITDEGASILASGLNNENSITHLNLSNNPIDTKGWQALANLLGSSRSRLKSLSIKDNYINDEEHQSLANSLVNNNTLTDLYLDNTDITIRGLQAYSTVLQSPRSRLKHLSLRKNRIKNRGAILLANSLVNNNTLLQLNLESDVSITSKGWKAFSRLLCRRSSIMDTYLSNHILQRLIGDEYTLSGDLMQLLLMNRDGDRQHVARQKIIKCHFTGENLDMQPFVDMKLGALLHVIAWMGRDGISLLYPFVRNMQSFFNFSDGVKADNGPAAKRQKVQLQSVAHCPNSYIGEWWHEKHTIKQFE